MYTQDDTIYVEKLYGSRIGYESYLTNVTSEAFQARVPKHEPISAKEWEKQVGSLEGNVKAISIKGVATTASRDIELKRPASAPFDSWVELPLSALKDYAHLTEQMFGMAQVKTLADKTE